MLKGVNRQVIEINETDNKYIEKAIVFVKPEYSNLGESELKNKLRNCFFDLKAPKRRKGRLKPWFLNTLLVLLSSGLGFLISAVFKINF